MKRQREEPDEAIADFEEQLSWGLQTLERLKGEEDAVGPVAGVAVPAAA